MDDLFLQKLLATSEPEEKAAFIAETLFNTLPAKSALIARQCSLFHWFDQGIVAALLNDNSLHEGELRDIYDQVNSLPFVEILPWGSAYNDLTRDGLLHRYVVAQPDLLKAAAQLAAPAYKSHGEDVKFMAEVFFCYAISGETVLAEKLLSELVQNAKKRGNREYIDGLQMLLQEAQSFSFPLPRSYSEILELSSLPHNTSISSASDLSSSKGKSVRKRRAASDTLGGRLRTARQNLHLSLADVAGQKYSTSLISQIERNRVDPSVESLQYLAERLQLPYDDLQVLARQHRESEIEANLHREYEAKYLEIKQLLARKQPDGALTHFRDKEFRLDRLPLFLRWRTLALRGETFFDLNQFSKAQRDFQMALTILPSSVPEEHKLDVISLYVHLAEATRELGQLEQALDYYQMALSSMDASVPLRYVGEAHWGLALVHYYKALNEFYKNEENMELFLRESWKHIHDAYTLYTSVGDRLHTALLQCQMALIEQLQGKSDEGKQRLLPVLEIWRPTLAEDFHSTIGEGLYQVEDRAQVVSVAARNLAHIECKIRNLERALENAQFAVQVSEISYQICQAEAWVMLGQVLVVRDDAVKTVSLVSNPEIEAAFRQAIDILADTEYMWFLSGVHHELGRYLLSTGRRWEAQREIEKGSELAGYLGFSRVLLLEGPSTN